MLCIRLSLHVTARESLSIKTSEAGKMVYLAEPSAAKPDDLSSSPRTHRVEGVHRFWPVCGHFLQYSVNVKET